MGAFFTNLQISNASTKAICAALPEQTDSRAYVSPASNGWVTVYLEATEDQDDETLRAIAAGLSQALHADVLGFLVHDSDITASVLTQIWRGIYGESALRASGMSGQDVANARQQSREQFDKYAWAELNKSTLPGLPSLETLKAARDQGPVALAALIAEKTSGQLTEIGLAAAANGLPTFLAALLKHGLDPNAADPAGRTILTAAAKHGTDSAIYRLVKAAAEGRK